jgi:hypothetical protein
LTNFRAELTLAYEDFEVYTISDHQPSFFEYLRFDYIKENGDTTQCALHIGDVVSIDTDEFGEGFAIVRGIFCHRNDSCFTFIIVDWFENTNRTKFDCPIYRLQVENNWRRIFSINVVSAVNTVHFIHNCKDGECIGDSHDFENDMYIRNMYYFKAV